jgi:hypothetical protein
MRNRIFFVLFTLVFSPLAVRADEGDLCYDPQPVVEISTHLDFRAEPRLDFYLPSRNSYGTYPTRAAAHIQFPGVLEIFFDHVLPPNRVGLAYTVHRLKIEIGEAGNPEHFVYDSDFTQGCTAPGISFFPGESIQLPAEKLPTPPADRPWGRLPVRVQTWGRL